MFLKYHNQVVLKVMGVINQHTYWQRRGGMVGRVVRGGGGMGCGGRGGRVCSSRGQRMIGCQRG